MINYLSKYLTYKAVWQEHCHGHYTLWVSCDFLLQAIHAFNHTAITGLNAVPIRATLIQKCCEGLDDIGAYNT